MKNTWNWGKFINLTQLKDTLTSSEIASVIASAASKVLYWHDYKGKLVVSVQGRGGRFVSYWQLSRAVEWLVKAIENCWDAVTWCQLRKWIKTVWKSFKYSKEAKEQVEQALEQQQTRLENRPKAEDKANLFVNLMGDCQEHKSLALAEQLFYRQRAQLEKYPDLIERVMQAGQRQRAYLHSYSEQNQKATALLEAANQPRQDDPEDTKQQRLSIARGEKIPTSSRIPVILLHPRCARPLPSCSALSATGRFVPKAPQSESEHSQADNC